MNLLSQSVDGVISVFRSGKRQAINSGGTSLEGNEFNGLDRGDGERGTSN